MATKFEPEYPTSPDNYESEGEEEDTVEQEEESKPKANTVNVANLLKKLQSSGALIKAPKEEHRCYTCEIEFPDWEELETHLITHVCLPSVVITKLPSDDEDMLSGDEWSEEEEEPPPKKTPQKIDISQILNKPGLCIKKPIDVKPNSSDSALNKLSGLGFTIKKNSTPIKQETPDNSDDVMKKLDKLGGIKLKLKSDGNNTNTFKVINGLKDFTTSDDEQDDEDKPDQGDFDEEQEKLEQASDEEKDSFEGDQTAHKISESEDSDKSQQLNKNINAKIGPIKDEVVNPSTEFEKSVKIPTPLKIPIKSGRPVIKQTPKRGANLPVTSRESQPIPSQTSSAVDRRESRDTNMENITVKQEVNTDTDLQTSNTDMPLFSKQIKTERTSPPPLDTTNASNVTSTPMTASVKTEVEPPPVTSSQSLIYNQNMSMSRTCPTPLLSVTKKEDPGVTIIEINGDSNDEDDDCCVVSATPAPDIKPIVPKTEPPSYPLTTPYSTSQSNYSSSSVLSHSTLSTEKQHSFDWNAPDSKPPIDMLEKSADDIFESLLSSSKKESNLTSSMSDASEYISLDTLGPQHSCDVCNTRFTDISLLEDHRRTSGHSQSLVAPSSSLLPYSQPSSNILQSLLPVKQLAEQVGKLSGIGSSGTGFTHQQNVMINIQAYPGSSGMMPPQQYSAYPSGANIHPGFAQTSASNMYGTGATMPGPYPNQNYMGAQSYGQQFQPPMSQSGYPGPIPPNSYASTPYSTESPLQSMQQSVYGPSPSSLSQPIGQMGPPGPMASPYASVSSPGAMKPPTSTSSGIKIQNVQTFPPGHMMSAPGGQSIAPGTQIGQSAGQPGNQMPSPSQIRMAAGVNVANQRPRMGMGTIRGGKPTIRPGIQVHGQIRGAKPGGPRMPMKRPGGMGGGPLQKKRPDMLLPGKHDNEDCQVMAMQKQRDGLPMIQSIQGAKDKLNLGSQISITKKTVNKEANAMANVLASRGIMVKQKQKSRSPSPERPLPHIPNLGSGMSIKHSSKSSNFTIPEAKVGGSSMLSCKICKKMFGNHTSLTVHMANAHPQSKIPVFKCDECPASYPKSLQLQHHKRVFHNVTGPNRELGLPVVDLSQEDNLQRLSSLGIYSFIPLANREQASGCFGIPVISVHNAQNGLINSLQALGADGLLSLGPLKPLPNS